MFCKKCGNKIEGNLIFCTSCGASSDNHQHENNKEQMKRVVENNKESFDWSKTIKILIGIAIVGWIIYANIDSGAIDKNNTGLNSFDSGNSIQAVQQFRDAANSAVSSETKIETLKNLGYVYSSEGQNSQAIEAFKEALVMARIDTFDYYLISGEIALLEGKPNAAIVAYNKAYEKDSNNFQINNALAIFYMDIDSIATQYVDYKKALQYAQKAAQLSDLQLAKQNLGLAYYLNENYTQAISVLSTVTLDNDSYTAYLLGLSYAGNNDPVNAKYYLRKAIAGGKVEISQEVYDYINNN